MATHDFAYFKRPWWGVLALTFAAFVFNTTEFVPVGLLTSIGTSLDMEPTDVGLMLTIYAWTVAVASMPLTLLVRNVERRKLMMQVFALFIVSHIVTGVAPNFTILMIGRIGIAFAHAVFWSISVSMVVRLVPADDKSRALGFLSIGTSIAMVAGIPIGRVIGEALGWRTTFQIIGCAAAVVMAALWVTLPELPSMRAGSLRSLPGLLKTPMLMVFYAVTVLTVTAHFSVYTYFEPFVHLVNHASNGRITYLLVLFGVAGVPAAICFHRLYPRQPRQFVLGAVTLVAACLLLLFPFALTIGTLSVHVLLWGGLIISFGLAMQAQVLELAPDATDLAVSLFSGLYNVGIGAGALLGNYIAHEFGLPWVGSFGGVVGVVSAVFCWVSLVIARRVRERRE
ncbi:sugar transporter [Paraburkholderia sp.]|uniref:sugar transporter n=1 Tax=Paraburkholderia sp. TaxID=1926495 RepID=UPI0023A3DC88|nr:sugar transporter [Paraburkholderia sp.]MDE1179965.1 sugar transporter [Paraburkholderia sp.]